MEITKTFNKGTKKEKTVKFDIIVKEKGVTRHDLITNGYDFWEPEEGGNWERESAESLGIDTGHQFFYVKFWYV